jgi:acetylornithine deacetylase/succinyl-diaminopimelate desuccinylase-like protein
MVKKGFEKVINQLREKDNNFKAEVDVINFAEPSETSPNEKIVKIARQSVKNVIGKDPGVTPFPATCDMRFLVNQAHVPTVILGPGSLHQAHTIDEYVEVKQVLDVTKIYALIMLKVLGKWLFKLDGC